MKYILRKTLRFILVFVCALALFFFSHQLAKAANSIQFSPTGGTKVSGFLNASNEGFTVTTQLDDISQVKKAELLLDGSAFVPPIEGTSLGGTNVIFTSETLSPSELRTKVPAGPHILKVEKYLLSDPMNPILVGTVDIVADYQAPTAVADSAPSSKLLKIGDQAIFSLVGDEKLSKVSSNYNHKAVKWSENPDSSWTGIYTVSSGENDQNIPLALSDVKITDLAGNQTTLADQPTSFTIDAHAPKIKIQSPENAKIYTTKNIALKYSVDDPKVVISILLNGKPIESKDNLNLADGSYTLSIKATDIAGNVSIAYSSFSIDTTPPSFSLPINPDAGKVEKGWTIVFDGTTEPGAQVMVEILSDTKSSQTVADANGHFRLEFQASDLEVGNHDAYITITDLSGNSQRVKVSSFEIYSLSADQSTKLALSSSSIVSDVNPQVVASKENPTEVASSGKLGSASESSRAGGINWSLWILILGLVVFASALATAGYYGYEWLAVSSESRRRSGEETVETDEEIVSLEKQRDVSQVIKEIAKEPDEPEKKLEGKEEKKDDVPKTRW